MTTYDLYLESGPKHKKTMVHVPELLGCVATGPTTADAVAATPGAIQAFLRLLARHGDDVDPEAPFGVKVAEHITEGEWVGNGSPYIVFPVDFEPLDEPELRRLTGRFTWISGELASWARSRDDAQLDLPFECGRTERGILLHVLGAQGVYLSAALGGAPGFSALHGAAERGERPLGVALAQSIELAKERIATITADERNQVRELTGRSYTVRKALRRMLEHNWEHLAELSRRPGGPEL